MLHSWASQCDMRRFRGDLAARLVNEGTVNLLLCSNHVMSYLLVQDIA